MKLLTALPPAHAHIASLLGTEIDCCITVMEAEAVAKLLRQIDTLFLEIRGIVNI